MIYSAELTLKKHHRPKDGTSNYIHIMYSDVENPTVPEEMSTEPLDYMGVCVTNASAAPADPAAYQWAKVKGEDGKRGSTGLPGKDGADGVSSYVHIKFSNDGGQTFTSNEGEDPGLWIGVHTDSDPEDPLIPDLYTWAKIAGEKGEDSTSVTLTNESHTFQGGDKAPIPSETSSKVLAFTGTKQMPVEIGIVPTPKGMTFTVTNNHTVNAGFTIHVDETLTQYNGTLSIPLTVSGTAFTKAFSWTVSMRGEKGDTPLCMVSGDQVFTYESGSTAPTVKTLTLYAEYLDAAHKEWQYKDASGAWTGYSPAKTETSLQISPNDIAWNDGSTAVLRAIDTTETIYDSITLLKVRDGNTGEAAVTAVLSNDSHTIPAGADGANGDYFGAETTISVYKGTTEISDEFTYTAVPSEGITGSLKGRTYTVTDMTADSGYVDITGSKSGYPDITKRFNLSLSKAGWNATAYWMLTNADVIFKNDDGLDPQKVSITGKCKTGTDSIADYAARFEIYNNKEETPSYSSTVDETGCSYTVPTASESIRVVMKEAGGTGVVLDEQNIPVVTDGRPGYDGYTIYLTNQNDSFPCDSSGNIIKDTVTSTSVIAYEGIKEVTPVVGTLPAVPGLSLSKISDGSGKTMVIITALAGTALARQGSLEIPVIIGDKTFPAVFSWTKLMDASGLEDEITTIKETAFFVNKDEQKIEAIVKKTQIGTKEDGTNVTVGDMYGKSKHSAFVALNAMECIRRVSSGSIDFLSTGV
ncbi:MAG: hypothetical protein ACOYBE_01590 [Blautia sp.]|jgi:hypothetical protein